MLGKISNTLLAGNALETAATSHQRSALEQSATKPETMTVAASNDIVIEIFVLDFRDHAMTGIGSGRLGGRKEDTCRGGVVGEVAQCLCDQLGINVIDPHHTVLSLDRLSAHLGIACPSDTDAPHLHQEPST